MRVKCHSGGARRGEGQDEGGITEEGQGAAGAEETWRGDEWARGEVDRNTNTQSRSLSEGKAYAALKVSKTSCAYEPKLLGLFWELIGTECAGLKMSMEEEETDEIRG
jgi:hypothetical protein